MFAFLFLRTYTASSTTTTIKITVQMPSTTPTIIPTLLLSLLAVTVIALSGAKIINAITAMCVHYVCQLNNNYNFDLMHIK